MLKVWNMVLVALAFELSVFGTFLTRSGVVNSIHSFAKSPIGSVVPRVRRHLVGVLAHADHVAAAAAEGAHEARVGAVARGDVPLQQPAARRALPDDPVGRPLPDRDAARQGRDADDRPAVLRLLPARLRAAAAAADGHRPADRLAEDERARARADASPGRSGSSIVVAASRWSLVGAGSSKPGLIAYTFSAFVLATIVLELVRGTRATGSLFTLVARNRRRYGGYIVHAAIVLARDRHRRLERVRQHSRARALSPGQCTTVGGYTLTLRRRAPRRATPERDARRSRCCDVSGRWHGTLETGRQTSTSVPPEPAQRGRRSRRTGCARRIST